MVSSVHDVLSRLRTNVESVVYGKPDVVQLLLTALLAGDHILLEDVPGVGKTLLGKALAKSIDGKFTRIQFTPDLLPSDILGSGVYHASEGTFKFHPGPVFANVVLGDEINRAPPRTQSALLEAMSEKQVSVDGETHPLQEPFMVIATQNPFEFEGTYLLPESQLDRFLLRIQVGYPSREAERRVLVSHQAGEPVDHLQSVATLEEVKKAQTATRAVQCKDATLDYLQDLVEATRTCPELRVGLSTRGALGLFRACQALALLERRDFIVPDDVKRLAIPVIAHRVVPRGFAAGSDRSEAEAIIQRILQGLTVPA